MDRNIFLDSGEARVNSSDAISGGNLAAFAKTRVFPKKRRILSSARNIRVTSSARDFLGSVSTNTPVNILKFKVKGIKNVIFDANGLSDDVNIALVTDKNRNKSINAEDIIAVSSAESTTPEKIDTILTEGEYFLVTESSSSNVSPTTSYNLRCVSSPVIEWNQKAKINLFGLSESTFNQVDDDLRLKLAGIKKAKLPTIRVYKNGEQIDPRLVNLTKKGLVVPNLIQERLNNIQIYGVKDQQFSLLKSFALWGGDQDISINVQDSNGLPAVGVPVNIRLGDDQSVQSQQVTNAQGVATFSRIVNQTVFVETTDANNNFASAGVTGDVGQVTLKLTGIKPPSSTQNNDFSLGTEGWDIGNASVEILQEDPQVNLSTTSITKSKKGRNRALRAVPNFNLQLNTQGEGEQSISRTFKTDPGTTCVTLRYKFITSEVPGGYFGSRYNDYFRVSLRSSRSGNRVESNSMNGLGLAAFDASGSTQFREITLPVNPEGDTVQADVAVANVADGLLGSTVIIDSIESDKQSEGYKDIEIGFKAFIPSPAVSLTNEFLSFIQIPIYGGDNRGLGQQGTSRVIQNGVINLNPQKPLVKSEKATWGQTTEYKSSQGNQVDGKPFWWWQLKKGQKPVAAQTLPVTPDNNRITFKRVDKDTVKVDLWVDGKNPLNSGAPALNAELSLYIRQKSGCEVPEFRVEGSHDGFPAYELYINKKRVYGTSPDVTGDTPFSLFWPMEKSVSIGWQNIKGDE